MSDKEKPKSKNYIDKNNLVKVCNGYWIAVVTRLAPELIPSMDALESAQPIPSKSGFHLKLFADFNDTGRGYAYGEDGSKVSFYDGISLLAWYFQEVKFYRVLKMVYDLLESENDDESYPDDVASATEVSDSSGRIQTVNLVVNGDDDREKVLIRFVKNMISEGVIIDTMNVSCNG